MRPSDPVSVFAGLLLAASIALQGCTPRCQEVCNKVLNCELGATRVAQEECILSCRLEEALYDDWEDDSKRKAFKAHKRCIRSSSCEEIADGECYDDELFIVEPQSPIEG